MNTRTITIKESKESLEILTVEFKERNKVIRRGTFYNFINNGDTLMRVAGDFINNGVIPQNENGLLIHENI